MPSYLFFLVFLLTSYAVFTLALVYYWSIIPVNIAPPIAYKTKISVIIPVRNEAKNIGALMKDLAQQSYDPNLFEVIVADDGSTDNTPYILETFKENSQLTLRTIFLDQNFKSASPKKRAIETALKGAEGELIVTTDGDCRVGPDWLMSIVGAYQSTGPKLISGPVTFTDELTITDHLQTVEFSSLIGSGAASIAAGAPSMCNGANLAYEKKAFEEVGGFSGNEHIASGDDEFLLHKIAQKYPGKIHFLKDPRSIVRTAPHQSWQAFFQQRKRWASKWKHYQNPVSILLAIYIFSCNATLLVTLGLALFGLSTWPQLFLIFLMKWVAEWLFIGKVLKFLNKTKSIFFILLVQVLYPFYVTLFGLVAQKPVYVWKDRELR